MTRLIRTFPILILLSLGAVTSIASATNYSLWINGRNGNGVVGNYNSFTYWGPAATAAGVNKKAVNWDWVQQHRFAKRQNPRRPRLLLHR